MIRKWTVIISGKTMGAFLNIPGNIKQASLPFNLDSDAPINAGYINADSGYTAQPQLFTFRTSDDVKNYSGPLGIITPYPHSLARCINDDIGYKLTFSGGVRGSNENDSGPGNIITMEKFLNMVPYIQIREYLPDARLDQVLNAFSAFSDGFNKAASSTESSDDGSSLKVKLSKFASNLKDFTKKISENGGVFNSILDGVDDLQGAKYINSPWTTEKGQRRSILTLPFLLYYRFLSTTTTNIYEVPYSGKSILKSDGSTGWDQTNNNFSAGYNGDYQAQSILGRLISYLGKNIKINTTPMWSPAESEPFEMQITVDLFNDRMDSAIKNFILINTLLPNNMWTQYHIYQHNPSVYDVKINGVQRFYMCSGKFSCDYKGVLREPSTEMIDLLCGKPGADKKKYANNNVNARLIADASTIKIPDVYSLTLNFRSLLPMNLNNYLFTYSNFSDMANYVGLEGSHQDSVATDFIKKCINPFVDKLKGMWPGGS